MASHSNSPKVLPGAARRTKLSQDIATLVNNPQGSDVEFKVGGDDSSSLKHKSTTVTLYAHSIILRCRSQYFAAVLDKEKHWRENSKSVISMPNISPKIFQDILRYIYTGSVLARNSEDVFELLTAADEIGLQELSLACQAELIRVVKYNFLGEDEEVDESEIEEKPAIKNIPIDVAIRTHIIPALDIASNHSLSTFSQKVLEIILPRMSIIIKSPNSYSEFVNRISSEVLARILTSNHLALMELSVWDLALSWGCHQTNVTKTLIEERFKNLGNADENEDELPREKESTAQGGSDESVASMTQLRKLKETLAPHLSSIRFSLFEDKDYARMVHIMNYFLPVRRSLEVKKFFIDPHYSEELDSPRIGIKDIPNYPPIFIEPRTWRLLRKEIFGTGGTIHSSSPKSLKFELLFRATQHRYTKPFHQHCVNKGPTLIIVKSEDGHLFGGVNFTDWCNNNSQYNNNTNANNNLNFLFALPDGKHRNDFEVFRKPKPNQYFTNSGCDMAPTFESLQIIDSGISQYLNNNNRQYSHYPYSSNSHSQKAPPNIPLSGNTSETSITGAHHFTVSDYEVYAISKK